MTRKMFKGRPKKVDRKIKNKERKIILFVDYFTLTDLPTLVNMKVNFCLLIRQGIIHTFKCYRKEVIKHILICLDKSIDPEINVLFAMKFFKRVWYTVSCITIKNCLKKARFWTGMGNQDFESEENYLEVELRNEKWAKFVSHETSRSTLTVEDCVGIDDDVLHYGERKGMEFEQELLNPQTLNHLLLGLNTVGEEDRLWLVG
ncbi:hypothetical protein PR048_008552 [Dryococelus australis]|uniref:DDE-1 domain-containing protein n=1 Tax=Dryococelus australis TaxID=614101 RepID=A0ABQ9HZ66_9NEOP|nr:hypothetical protein PR048_008552 [Dryococelus australis]